jgi:hypothetical protein
MSDPPELTIEQQYERLNILDAKSSGLLTFNAIFLTSISVWLGYVPLNVMHLILDLAFTAMLASCSLLLSVLWLRWFEPGERKAHPDAVRGSRTRRYLAAWGISAASIVVVGMVSLVHMAGTALNVLGRCDGACAVFYSERVFGNLDVARKDSGK